MYYRDKRTTTAFEAWLGPYMNTCVTRYNKDGSTIIPKKKEPGRFFGWLLKPFGKTSQRVILGLLFAMIVGQIILNLG